MRAILELLELIRSLFVYTPARDWDALLSAPDGSLTRDRNGDSSMSPMIRRLEDERSGVLDFIDRTVAEVEAAGRDLSETERTSLATSRSRVAEIDAQLTPLREFAELRDAHRSSEPTYRPAGDTGGRGLGTTEPRAYEYRTAGEFMADVAMATATGTQLDQHRADRSRARLESIGLTAEVNGTVQRANQTTADTPGILPENIVGQIINDVDAARPFVSSIGVRALDAIPGKTFHRPTVTQSTQVGEQTGGEKTQLPSRQMVISDVDFTKRTFGGWVNVSRQDIDWTSPSAWDALLTDLQEQYSIETEETAATDFAATVAANGAPVITLATATTMSAATVREFLVALYAAAAASYGVAKRLPDRIWASLDMWAAIAPVLAEVRSQGSGLGIGSAEMQSFVGNLAGVGETVVPSFPAGTLIIGPANRTEFYEERIGLLSVVEPKILGVEVAYGGYMANGTLKPAAYRRVAPHA
jgi:hypothetical protein